MFYVSILSIEVLIFHQENGHIKHTNPIIRKSKSLPLALIMMCATLLDPNKPNHYFSASPVRARERQIRAPKKRILGGIRRGASSIQHPGRGSSGKWQFFVEIVLAAG